MALEQELRKLLTLKQAAELKDMSPELLRHYIITGRGPRCYKVGPYCFYHIEDVELWDSAEYRKPAGRPKQ